MKASRDKAPPARTPPIPLTAPLFPEIEPCAFRKIRTYKRIDNPIWTENKAQFIRHYLRYFVQITKHGAYIDGFAGPQSFDHLEAWCAALVLTSEPKWLRRFYLCEISPTGLEALKTLLAAESDARDRKGRKVKRRIEIFPGDFNVNIESILCDEKIPQKEAAFCLLDQRTFECDWATVRKIAAFKRPPQNKIELLYFLGVGWIHRAFSGVKHEETLSRWWGQPGWEGLKDMSSWSIADLVRSRFVNELGYRSAAAYPIFESNDGNRIMYYMIHASDHQEAPALMVRAHARAVRALAPNLQPSLPYPETP
jgi:three-Cys-motif partner protein